MQKTVVLNVVGLTHELLGKHTPFLSQWAAAGQLQYIKPVLPAVTCTMQSCYLTGKWPSEHGIVGNGWYFRDECEIKFWRQSNQLVQAPKIWDYAKAADPHFTCNNLFWWYNMYSTADTAVTPRPIYAADGRKFPDCYTVPASLRDDLQRELGTFPLFDFWGPRTTIRSSQWIADAAKKAEQLRPATLTLIYLPHLDYSLQRVGPYHADVLSDLTQIDAVCADLIQFFEARGAQVIVLSEYGITAVDRPVDINRQLRKQGYLNVREERGGELLDAGVSEAFAVADHQLAHVYVKDPAKIPAIRKLIADLPGVAEVWGEEEKRLHHLDHARAGELIAVADSRSWFTYYYWLDDTKAPDFARTVDIHRKPGYDPAELFIDPTIKWVKPKILGKLLKKKLGFRYLLDLIPLDASLVKGSHGGYSPDPKQGPLLISKQKQLVPAQALQAIEVFNVLMSHLQN